MNPHFDPNPTSYNPPGLPITVLAPEPILTPRQWRYLIWIGVTLALGLAARFGLSPVAAPTPPVPPGWEELVSDVKTIKAGTAAVAKLAAAPQQ